MSGRKMVSFMITIIAGLSMAACKDIGSSTPSENTPAVNDTQVNFSWSNPSPYGIDNGRGLRDPFILKDGDWWYLTGTMAPYGITEDEKPRGVPLYKSQDLQNWEYIGIMVARPDDSENKWYQERFWAPEIFQRNGKYYITVNCCLNNGNNHGMLVAVSDNIEGPYTVMTEDEPLAYGNDAHFFVDDDGRTYIYGSDIWGAEIDMNTLNLMSQRTVLVSPVEGSDSWNGKRPNVGFEGPYVLKRNNVYYLFYSTWARGYEVGIAKSNESPIAGYILNDDPLYGGINEASCEHYGSIYEEDYYVAQDKFREVGHNSVFLGPDGKDWLVAHAFDYTDGAVKYVMNQLSYEADGSLIVIDPETGLSVKGPTYGTHTITFEQPQEARVLKALDLYGIAKLKSDYELPKKIDVLFDNGWREAYSVTWSDIVDTSSLGEQTISGTVVYDGVSYTCTANIRVRAY